MGKPEGLPYVRRSIISSGCSATIVAAAMSDWRYWAAGDAVDWPGSSSRDDVYASSARLRKAADIAASGRIDANASAAAVDKSANPAADTLTVVVAGAAPSASGPGTLTTGDDVRTCDTPSSRADRSIFRSSKERDSGYRGNRQEAAKLQWTSPARLL